MALTPKQKEQAAKDARAQQARDSARAKNEAAKKDATKSTPQTPGGGGGNTTAGGGSNGGKGNGGNDKGNANPGGASSGKGSDASKRAQRIQDELNAIYTSAEFLGMSKENQDLVKGIVEAYTPEQLRKVNLSKNELAGIYEDAKQSTLQEYQTNKDKYDQDYEQSLKQDTTDLQRALDAANTSMTAQNAADAANTAISDAQRQQNADQRIMSVKNLQDALAQSLKQYGIEAQRKADYLQNSLSDTQKQLDTTTSRADEDSVIQLRQLQREHETSLRSIQDNMTQRGMALSGIRLKAETTDTENYNDTVTTAQLVIQRQKEDVQTLADQQKRDVNLMTSQDLQDLVTKYTGIQQSAVQSAESILGTADTTAAIGSTDYAIGGINPTTDLYGSITGSLANSNTALDAQDAARALEATARTTTNSADLAQQYADYERTYGTKALQDQFGTTAIGTTDTYAGYTPVGNITGTSTENTAEAQTDNDQARADHEAQITQAEKDQAFITKAYNA